MLGCAILLLVAGGARAGERPEAVALSEPSRAERPAIRRPDAGRHAMERPSSGSWWMGTAGIALVLAALGGLSIASRRWRLPIGGGGGPLQVVGRAALSPRHAAYLLRAGDRVLIVGTGSQGPPTLLGELTDPAELRRLIPARGGDAGPEQDFESRSPGGGIP